MPAEFVYSAPPQAATNEFPAVVLVVAKSAVKALMFPMIQIEKLKVITCLNIGFLCYTGLHNETCTFLNLYYQLKSFRRSFQVCSNLFLVHPITFCVLSTHPLVLRYERKLVLPLLQRTE